MIAILKYNAGNIRSVRTAITRAGYDSIITNDSTELLKADKVIIPGVGEAGSAMRFIRQRGLDTLICSLTQPVLGICLGLQLMCLFSEEADTQCLGIFDAAVRRFPPSDKVPHMGWNNFTSLEGPLFKGITKEDDVYFVHSYYAELSSYTVAACNYIVEFGAAMQYRNFYATQFHPEKSADTGEIILKNFLEL